jgi:hypothetical protein
LLVEREAKNKIFQLVKYFVELTILNAALTPPFTIDADGGDHEIPT